LYGWFYSPLFYFYEIMFVIFVANIPMKKLLFSLSLLFVCCLSKAQITLEHTYSNENPNASGQVILFSANGEKIMMSDTGSNQVTLYNTDYTLWKTINVPIYTGSLLSNLNYNNFNWLWRLSFWFCRSSC